MRQTEMNEMVSDYFLFEDWFNFFGYQKGHPDSMKDLGSEKNSLSIFRDEITIGTCVCQIRLSRILCWRILSSQ